MNGERAPAAEREADVLPAPANPFYAVARKSHAQWALVFREHDPREPDLRVSEGLAGDRTL
jgi:hypothetical protein